MTAAMLVLLLIGLWFMTQLRIWRIHPARSTLRRVRHDLVDGPSLDHLVGSVQVDLSPCRLFLACRGCHAFPCLPSGSHALSNSQLMRVTLNQP